MFFESLPVHVALQDLAKLGAFAPSAPVHLGRARHKDLTSVGHLLDRFLSASAIELERLRTENPWPALSPLLEGLSENPEIALAGEGLFALALGAHARAWSLQPVIIPDPLVGGVLGAWHRVQPDAPRTLPPQVAMPALANAPLWPALLHLQPFQADWEQPLRRNHVHVLGGMLPGSWVMDPTPLPPGAVIPVLEIAAWEELSLLNASGRSFLISDPWGNDVVSLPAGADWSSSIAEAVAKSPRERRILTEVMDPSEGFLFALYEKGTSRTDYLGALAMHRDESGAWHVSRVAV
ncbi:hypothetical protein [Verrucomicrobium sp. BvORR034]|uniref:hypothetical protein n=1 Tax=Verrucomicrobium sp. BvORR034 TaxID=1396418 RepID=UPI000679C131|nr:hypothetical protein [Verrucomicrobium sp. BvORR034]